MKSILRFCAESGVLVATMALVPLAVMGCSKQASPAHPQAKSNAPGVNTSQGAKSSPASSVANAAGSRPMDSIQWIFVDGERPVPVVGSFERHFISAQQAQARNDKVTTAIELRSAAQSLQTNTTGTISLVSPGLQAATKNLSQLATQAETKKLDSGKLMKAFESAYDADLQAGSPGMLSDQWMKVYDEPLKHLTSARELLHNDPKSAALELRKAKAFVDIDTSRADGTYRNLLAAEATRIGELSRQIAKGKLQEPTKLDHSGVDATRVMAEFGLHNADVAWKAHDSKIAVQWLTAAVANLKQSIGWSGLADPNVSASLSSAESFASRTRDGAKVVDNEVSKQLDSVALDMKIVLMKTKPLKGESSTVAALTISSNPMKK